MVGDVTPADWDVEQWLLGVVVEQGVAMSHTDIEIDCQEMGRSVD